MQLLTVEKRNLKAEVQTLRVMFDGRVGQFNQESVELKDWKKKFDTQSCELNDLKKKFDTQRRELSDVNDKLEYECAQSERRQYNHHIQE